MVVVHGVLLSEGVSDWIDSKAGNSSRPSRNQWHWTPACFSIPLAENPHHRGLRIFGIVCRVAALGLSSSSAV